MASSGRLASCEVVIDVIRSPAPTGLGVAFLIAFLERDARLKGGEVLSYIKLK